MKLGRQRLLGFEKKALSCSDWLEFKVGTKTRATSLHLQHWIQFLQIHELVFLATPGHGVSFATRHRSCLPTS